MCRVFFQANEVWDAPAIRKLLPPIRDRCMCVCVCACVRMYVLRRTSQWQATLRNNRSEIYFSLGHVSKARALAVPHSLHTVAPAWSIYVPV